MAGNYRPARLGMNKEELIKGLKSIEKKLRHPNKYLTTTAYKKGLRKALPIDPEST